MSDSGPLDGRRPNKRRRTAAQVLPPEDSQSHHTMKHILHSLGSHRIDGSIRENMKLQWPGLLDFPMNRDILKMLLSDMPESGHKAYLTRHATTTTLRSFAKLVPKPGSPRPWSGAQNHASHEISFAVSDKKGTGTYVVEVACQQRLQGD